MKDLSNTPEKNIFGARLDELNELLDQAATLMGRRFIAPAEIDYTLGDLRRRLSLQKSGDAYAIVEAGPPMYDWQPLRSKSVEIRVEAAGHLTALWEACSERDVEARTKLETSIVAVEVFLICHGTAREP